MKKSSWTLSDFQMTPRPFPPHEQFKRSNSVFHTYGKCMDMGKDAEYI